MQLLIVGAGPVGLALALCLHRQGIAFRHVDRLPVASPFSRALAIQARTLEALEPLGLVEPILAEALRPGGIRVHLGGVVADIGFDHRRHARFPSVVFLPQFRTEALLAQALAAAGAPALERGVELASLDAATGEAVLRHADGAEERACFDLVLGADGAHSLVRKAAGIAFEGAAYEERFVLADGRVEGLAPDRMHVFPGTGTAGFFFPLPGDTWRVVIALPPGIPTPAEGDLGPMQYPGLRFAEASWWSAFRVSHRIAAGYRSGRAVLLGDAAHIHSPAGGQGMNLGIQDACSLAAALPRGAAALPRGEAALEEWAARRRGVAEMVVWRTHAMTRGILGASPVLRAARAVALRLVPRLPPARRRLEGALAGMDYPAALL
jgi:2-polyprenyl-6-methoxyphenol hydroxylase-like FAD-dependent oxidoreductase